MFRTLHFFAKLPLALTCCLATTACGGDNMDPAPGDDNEPSDTDVSAISVSGTVVDFESGASIEGSASVSTDGLSPAPTVSMTGAQFTVEGVAPFSTFHLLASSPPNYRSTYNVVVETADSNVSNLELAALHEDFVDSLYTEFALDADGGFLLAQLVDDSGAPRAGVPGDVFALDDAVVGPYFLDEERQPDAELSQSSASGYALFFQVEPGLASLGAAPDSGWTMAMADSPVAARTATLATITVSEGALEVPSGVSFAQDVAPIFEERGCVLCHDGGGIGKDLGGLHLNGAAEKMFRELTQELSPSLGITRVDPENPEESILLTYPSREDPPDDHPNATFLSKSDPDYLTILGWIQEGALQN